MSRNDPLRQLIEQFCFLPGIGERTALRLALHLIKGPKEGMQALASALHDVADKVKECPECFMITTEETHCSICSSYGRDKSILCVVATIQDLMAVESTGEYRGLYHVLHGTLAPMENIGPAQLRMAGLVSRLHSTSSIKEVIIATPPSVEGEATALYLANEMKEMPLFMTRIASGIPVGGDLQFADRLTLSRALFLRRGIS